MSLSVTLSVEKMSCASCVGRVDKVLSAVPGVRSVSVNLATETATIVGQAQAAELIEAANEAGYPAKLANPEVDHVSQRVEADDLQLRSEVALSAALTVPVFVLAMGSHVVPGIGMFIAEQLNHWIQAVLTTVVLAWPGRRFYRDGLPALMRGAPDMNSLVALGTSAAWVYSFAVILAPSVFPETARGVYFEAAAVIVTLILTGRWLEVRARGRTGAAIRALMNLQPRSARVVRAGLEQEIPVAEIRRNDIVILRSGERVPVDGEIAQGVGHVDESMLTGEAVPVAKSPGDAIIGGTVNGSGSLKIRVTHLGNDTVLAGIIRMVQQAQGAKLPVQALVDRITLWFVPVVLAIAAVTVVAWILTGPEPAVSYALVAGISVLIIACPCAMGLATPVSVMVAVGRAAELGVLFRKGDALQLMDGVDVIAFDKTGTLTAGTPVLTFMEVTPGTDRVTALSDFAAIEAGAGHPIASAILAAAREAGAPQSSATHVRAHSGLGMSGRIEGREILIGSEKMMRKETLDVSAFDPKADRQREMGKTVFYGAVDGKVVAAFGISDPVRDDARSTVSALQEMGISVTMITGDRHETARVVAQETGIDTVRADVMPDGKVNVINEIRESGQRVAFVGDGINDAPALAAADVGIAIGAGTDVAIEAADIVLMSGRPGGVLTAVTVSTMAMRNIRQNLFWAFGYNSVLIPVAAGALYASMGLLLSPMLAAAAMALSSVFVLVNALRLRKIKGADSEYQ